jgi:CRP/FNR family transcriptional regulator
MLQKQGFEKLFPCKSDLFKGLNDNELNLIQKNTVEAIYKKGESVFKQGTKPYGIVFIKKGLVKISFFDNDQELVLSLESRGKIIGLQALFPSDVYPYSAFACEEVKACLFDIQTVKSIIPANPGFSSALMNLMNEYAIFIYKRMACLSLHQIHGRFAHLLLHLSLSVYKKKVFTTPLSKKDMALVTNMSQESLSRVIHDFISDNLIAFEDNRISILNYQKIKHLSIAG